MKLGLDAEMEISGRFLPFGITWGGRREEGEQLGETDGKGDVRNLCEGEGENFPKGLQNLHIMVLFLRQAKGIIFWKISKI